MSFYDAIRIGASGAVDFEVERSLRFNDGDAPKLQRTLGSSGNRRTFTWSGWVKRGAFGHQALFSSTTEVGSGNSHTYLIFNSSHQLNAQSYNYSGGTAYNLITNQLFRDPSAWYHIVWAVDTTQSTSSNRIKLYVNGEQVTSFSTAVYPSQDYEGLINNSSYKMLMGNAFPSLTNNSPFDGYLAEATFIDGLQLTPTSFGETNAATGQWVPINTSGLTFGTNGFRLKFSDNSGTTATTLGKDSSGNGNNFTPSNFSVSAGKDDDSMFDTPTNNFPTLSPLDKSLVGTMSNGNLRISYNYKPASKTFRSTMALPSTGKIYWEWENEETTAGRWQTGLVRYTNEAGVVDFQGYNDADYLSVSFGGSMWNGTTHINPAWSSYPTFYSGERVAIAIDCSNGKVWIGKVASNGSTTWYDDDGTTDGDPAGGTNETCTLASFTTATEWMPVVMWHDGGAASSTTYTSNINFGNHSFLGTIPTGFEKLSSKVLDEPTILLPDKHFDTLLYTETGSSQNITGLEFQPDWVWIKKRNSSENHNTADAVRGAGLSLRPNTNGAETSSSGAINAFLSTGFTVVDAGETNENGHTYAGWNWNAGGSTVTNGDGSIDTQVRANTTAGFSIITYTGNGSSGATIGHGLGVAPDVVIIKRRDGSNSWQVFHQSLGAGKFMDISSNYIVETSSNRWNDTAPTSSVITLGNNSNVNSNTGTCVGYVFSEVEGYSKFGSYTGNGNADGTFVYTGFRPALVILKNTDTVKHWGIFDNKRIGFNVENYALFPSDTAAEDTADYIDFVSNGFKLRSTALFQNKSGDEFIYLAFAETPFRNARAR